MTNEFQVISFDIGIKNLAYCILEKRNVTECKIKHVEKVDLQCRKNDTQKIIDSVLEVLDDILFNKLDMSLPIIVLIESQMTSVMKSIQTSINVFFKIQMKYQSIDVKTQYLSARHKLNLIDQFKNEYTRPEITEKNQYKQNKVDSVHFGTWLLSESKFKDLEILATIQKSKKKDDMFDCVCMVIYYVKKMRSPIQ